MPETLAVACLKRLYHCCHEADRIGFALFVNKSERLPCHEMACVLRWMAGGGRARRQPLRTNSFALQEGINSSTGASWNKNERLKKTPDDASMIALNQAMVCRREILPSYALFACKIIFSPKMEHQ